MRILIETFDVLREALIDNGYVCTKVPEMIGIGHLELVSPIDLRGIRIWIECDSATIYFNRRNPPQHFEIDMTDPSFDPQALSMKIVNCLAAYEIHGQ